MAEQMRVQWLRNAGHLLVFILRVIDEPVLRMSIEKVLSGIRACPRLHARGLGRQSTRIPAGGEGRPGDGRSLQTAHQDIKNCIICWNYLYLSQKLAEIDDPAKREELLQAMAHGSAAALGI